MKLKKLNTRKSNVSRDLGQFFQSEKLYFFTLEVLPVDIAPHFLIFYQFNNCLLSTYQIPGLELNLGYSDTVISKPPVLKSSYAVHCPSADPVMVPWEHTVPLRAEGLPS